MDVPRRDKPPVDTISTAAVQILNEYTGREPTQAKTVASLTGSSNCATTTSSRCATTSSHWSNASSTAR